MNRRSMTWTWVEGNVDRAKEHIELRYGDASKTEYEDWRPVALIGTPQNFTFPVKWLTDESSPEGKEAIESARKELDFFLVEKGEPDPWAYAQYHCGTASNMYSMIHWSYFPEGGLGDRVSSTVVMLSSPETDHQCGKQIEIHGSLGKKRKGSSRKGDKVFNAEEELRKRHEIGDLDPEEGDQQVWFLLGWLRGWFRLNEGKALTLIDFNEGIKEARKYKKKEKKETEGRQSQR